MALDSTPNDARTASSTGDSTPASPSAIGRTVARHPRPLGGDTARSTLGTSSLSLTGMVLDNQPDAHQMRVGRKPDWLRAKVPGGEGYLKLKSLIDEHRLHTVCQEASCPNMGECWSRGTATIMILGDTCTRSCGFCNVKTGKPMPVDDDEPRRRLRFQNALPNERGDSKRLFFQTSSFGGGPFQTREARQRFESEKDKASEDVVREEGRALRLRAWYARFFSRVFSGRVDRDTHTPERERKKDSYFFFSWTVH